MKNITVSVDDDVYHAARVEAAKRRKSLSAMVREFLRELKGRDDAVFTQRKAELERLFAMADARPKQPGSVGPLNREELHQRGLSGH